ncbi:hypothetical protein ACQZV8_17735, partial [Magnetococcales bacterium HHB-1]
GGYQPNNTNMPATVAGSMACRAALVVAQRNLLSMVQGVRVVGETYIRQVMMHNDHVKSVVSGMLRGYTISGRKLWPDGACQVTLQLPLQGALAASLWQSLPQFSNMRQPSYLQKGFKALFSALDHLPSLIASAEASTASSLWLQRLEKMEQRVNRLEQRLAAKAAQKSSNQLDQSGAIDIQPTGLVIDARGSRFIPSLSPNIRRLRGGVIYPNRQQRLRAQREGNLVSLFMNDLFLAQNHPRVGDRPLVVKALRSWGKARTEIIVSNRQADRLQQWWKQTDGLQGKGVIIVMD